MHEPKITKTPIEAPLGYVNCCNSWILGFNPFVSPRIIKI